MKLIELFLRRPLTTVLLFFCLFVFGLVSLFNIPIDLLPDISYPKLSLMISYRGASPLEIEELVLKELESHVATIPHVRETQSIAFREGAKLTVTFHWGTDMDIAFINLREKIETASSQMPQDNIEISILRYDPSSKPIMEMVFSNGSGLHDFLENMMKPSLEQIRGVAYAQINGLETRIAKIEIDAQKANYFNITSSNIRQSISNWTATMPSGFIEKDGERFSLVIESRIYDIDEIKKIPVRESGLNVITVSDLADVYWDYEDNEGEIRYNQTESYSIKVFKESGSNTIGISRNIRQVLENIRETHPEYKIKVIQEEAGYINNSIRSLRNAILIGSILVFFTISLFLGSFRESLIISIVIPIAVIITFIMMFLGNITVNLMSLGGLVLGIGLFVDNSIVILEAIYKHKEKGHSPYDSVLHGLREVLGPVIASTLTTIAVFFPIVYISGVTAELFKDQALTVSFSMIVSLFVSITLLPVLASWKKRKSVVITDELSGYQPESHIGRVFYKLYRYFEILVFLPVIIIIALVKRVLKLSGILLNYLRDALSTVFKPFLKAFNKGYIILFEYYHGKLIWILKNPRKGIYILILLTIMCVLLFYSIDKELFPQPNTPYFEFYGVFPEFYSYESLIREVNAIEDIFLGFHNIEFIYSEIGRENKTIYEETGNPNSLRIYGKVMDNRYIDDLFNLISERIHKKHDISYSIRREEVAYSNLLTFDRDRIELKIIGIDLDEMINIAISLQEKLNNIDGIEFDIFPLMSSHNYMVQYNMENIIKYQVRPGSLTTFISSVLRGTHSEYIHRMDRKYPIMLYYQDNYRRSIQDLLNLDYITPFGHIPINQLISLKESEFLSQITREDQNRVISLRSGYIGQGQRNITRQISRIIEDFPTPPGYHITAGALESETRDSLRSMYLAFSLSCFLVFMILASKFESLKVPFIIIFSIPMGLFGSIGLLFLFGQSINIMSLIGMVLLVGVVVNDSIVKTDYLHNLINLGYKIDDAILKTSKDKYRPVLITTVTTILALLPSAIGLGEGAELQRPFALSFIGGMLSGTILTLLYNPLIYKIIMKKY